MLNWFLLLYRCMGGFIGVNYAASKLPWTSSLQVSCTLALISAGLWFLFDRTFHGFLISFTVASMGTVVAYFLVLNGWYRYVEKKFGQVQVLSHVDAGYTTPDWGTQRKQARREGEWSINDASTFMTLIALQGQTFLALDPGCRASCTRPRCASGALAGNWTLFPRLGFVVARIAATSSQSERGRWSRGTSFEVEPCR